MNDQKETKKNPKKHHPSRDSIELHGELMYKKNTDEVDVDEVYHDPKVPGRFAGDC
ncbi:MAG: hypothetical protein WCR55_02000 [Lentisphaerota bacterium]